MSDAPTSAAAPDPTAAAADLVLVVPCYNEAARIDREAFAAFTLDSTRLAFCFVNDGSPDDTLAILRDLCRRRGAADFVVDLRINAGKAEAVRQGLLAALATGARTVGFWDADLATPLAELPRFCDVLERHPQVEIVLGSRVRLLGRSIQRSATRHYLGRVFATGASLTLGLPVYDTQCGAKLFRATDTLRELLARPFLTRWVFDVELLARYLKLVGKGEPAPELRLYELPLLRWTDVAGSKVRPWDFVRSGFELLRIWRRYRR
jgi:dolichyl-phosphate beta-glucosyltransferase